jgi:hypothetical protein
MVTAWQPKNRKPHPNMNNCTKFDDLCAAAPVDCRSFGKLSRPPRKSHYVAEQPNNLVSDLRRRIACIDSQWVLAGVRFFQGVYLASQQFWGHEMPMTSCQMLGD